jgi:hypothetical protein
MAPARSSRLGIAALIAWIAMEVVAAAAWGVGYVRGTVRDQDIANVAEAMMMPVLFAALPFAAYAFGMLWPSMRAVEAVTRGRLSRVLNILVGAALTIPFLLVIIGAGRVLWPQRTTFIEQVARIFQNSHGDGWVLLCLVAGGMIVGARAASRRALVSR